jgi:hypothetical protein
MIIDEDDCMTMDVADLQVWDYLPKGCYYICSDGNIHTGNKKVNAGKHGGTRIIPSRQLKLKVGTDGYYQVQLQHKGKSKYIRIHRLVALAFVSLNYSKGLHVNHKDGIKTNNHYTNLEWVTNEENLLHAHKTGLMEGSKKTMFKKGHKPWNKGQQVV